MITGDPQGVIELGNINVKCLIFSIDNNNILKILSSSVFRSDGMHNGVIVNLSKASNAIRSCISSAEKKAGVLLKKINVIVEQTEFLCTKFSKSKKIGGSKIHKDDIEFLLKEAKKQVMLNDVKQSIIHIFNHNYIVDNKTFVEEPIDVYADNLSHEITFITTPKNNIRNIEQAFNDCDIEIERFISCTFALAAKLLNENELQLGSILINMGFEKTSLGIFKNLALAHSITLPIGVNHIVKDISKVCSLSLEESEIIRNKIDFSFQDNTELFDKNGYLKDIYFNSSTYRKISNSLILNIVKARVYEIFEMIKKQVTITELKTIFGMNFFITGGGSNLLNINKYFSDFFKINIKRLNIADKKKDEIELYENFSSCLGAIKIIKDGWETEAIPEPKNIQDKKMSFFSRIFGNR